MKMQINLFDSVFRHAICSTGWQTPEYITYVRNGTACYDGWTFFTDAWINHPAVDEVECPHKVGWLREPYCLHPGIYEKTLDNLDKFEFIMTYHRPFLKLDSRYRYVPYGGTWLDKTAWSIWPKRKNISMLIGDKMSAPGHKFRREIADLLTPDQVDFYGTKGQPVNYSPQTKLTTLRDYAFTIITETCQEDGLFTEWLIDALLLGTIPIYWGCPDAGNYFVEDSILSFETIAELTRIISMIATSGYENTYRSHLAGIRDNFVLAKEYAITEDWIYRNYLK